MPDTALNSALEQCKALEQLFWMHLKSPGFAAPTMQQTAEALFRIRVLLEASLEQRVKGAGV